MSFLSVDGIHKRFGRQTALQDVRLDIDPGELVAILGPSGCGKTTLLRILAGLESPDQGRVVIQGRDCTALPPARRNFGIVFQSYALYPNMTVEGNILFGLSRSGKMDREQKRGKVAEVLELVDLTDHRKKYPHQLSGGQQQRTALARAIALSPDFLLLDEPLSALDAKVRVKLRSEIRAIQQRLNMTTILVTHDQEEALTMADRIVVMNQAKVEQIGTPKEIYRNPATPFVAGFIGSMNFYSYGDSLVGVRPEDIRLSPRAAGQDFVQWNAQVKRVEFRGPLTRIYGELPTGSEIYADVASDEAERQALCDQKRLYFYTRPERTLTYQGREGAAI
ncbi:MAG: ATP-binding cassette domain-containing protein [Clostridiales bacterium]|nr:ATP-binding cassette domain-containing protein [Clostridiales bacterium]